MWYTGSSIAAARHGTSRTSAAATTSTNCCFICQCAWYGVYGATLYVMGQHASTMYTINTDVNVCEKLGVQQHRPIPTSTAALPMTNTWPAHQAINNGGGGGMVVNSNGMVNTHAPVNNSAVSINASPSAAAGGAAHPPAALGSATYTPAPPARPTPPAHPLVSEDNISGVGGGPIPLDVFGESEAIVQADAGM